MGTDIKKIITKFSALTNKPEKHLSEQYGFTDEIKNIIKSLYDFTKLQEESGKTKNNLALPKIIIEDFDDEQIWQQIELQNTECWDQLTWDVAKCISSKNDLLFPVSISEQYPNVEEKDSNAPDSVIETGERIKPLKKPKLVKSKNRSSIVDDQFFNLKEMEKFLVNEEKVDGKGKKSSKKDNNDDDDDDESIDLFEEIDDEVSENEDKNNMMYTDFFNEDGNNDTNKQDDYEQDDDDDNMDSDFLEDNEQKKDSKKKVRFSGLDSNDSEDDASENGTNDLKRTEKSSKDKQSEFELRQERLKQQISKLEEKTLKEAPWQLKGEVDSKRRPENSLLQEVLDFDLTTRPPPNITEETTITLEGLIKQRVKDKAWDDVVRKEKPVNDQLNFKKSVVLDQSKSKLSLAQVYEAEYLKQKQSRNGEVNEDEPESHKEIRDIMSKLFSKLDALCHYHYTPKPPQAEVKIVSNTPAISMEEVAPVATSEATLLAPEEIKKKQRGELMSKEERTKTDKNRERRMKKQLQRKNGNVMKVTDQRNTKTSVEATDKSLKTSKAFFQQLNDEATSIIKSKNKKPVKNKGH